MCVRLRVRVLVTGLNYRRVNLNLRHLAYVRVPEDFSHRTAVTTFVFD